MHCLLNVLRRVDACNASGSGNNFQPVKTRCKHRVVGLSFCSDPGFLLTGYALHAPLARAFAWSTGSSGTRAGGACAVISAGVYTAPNAGGHRQRSRLRQLMAKVMCLSCRRQRATHLARCLVLSWAPWLRAHGVFVAMRLCAGGPRECARQHGQAVDLRSSSSPGLLRRAARSDLRIRRKSQKHHTRSICSLGHLTAWLYHELIIFLFRVPPQMWRQVAKPRLRRSFHSIANISLNLGSIFGIDDEVMFALWGPQERTAWFDFIGRFRAAAESGNAMMVACSRYTQEYVRYFTGVVPLLAPPPPPIVGKDAKNGLLRFDSSRPIIVVDMPTTWGESHPWFAVQYRQFRFSTTRRGEPSVKNEQNQIHSTGNAEEQRTESAL